MRIANLVGRLALLDGGDRALDVEQASGTRFRSDPQAVYDLWDEVGAWAAAADLSAAGPFDPDLLGAPVPAPRQVFAIGLIYGDYAAESGFDVPDRLPPTFAKWASCITGPYGDIVLPADGRTDWEVEVVAVIGRYTKDVAEADAWNHVAGLAAGQDLSERITQLAGPAPQFGLGKSFTGFGPIGPWLVISDELANPDDLELGCRINGEQMQKSRTRELIFRVPALVSRLSAILPLLPGDLVFTGTPAGVGFGRDPERWLAAGDELVSYVEGIGGLGHRFIPAPAR